MELVYIFLIVIACIFVAYMIALLLLSRWISKTLHLEYATIVALGFFFPPAWIGLLIWAATEKAQEARSVLQSEKDR